MSQRSIPQLQSIALRCIPTPHDSPFCNAAGDPAPKNRTGDHTLTAPCVLSLILYSHVTTCDKTITFTLHLVECLIRADRLRMLLWRMAWFCIQDMSQHTISHVTWVQCLEHCNRSHCGMICPYQTWINVKHADADSFQEGVLFITLRDWWKMQKW